MEDNFTYFILGAIITAIGFLSYPVIMSNKKIKQYKRISPIKAISLKSIEEINKDFKNAEH